MKNLDLLKIRKQPNVKQINGVPFLSKLVLVDKTNELNDRNILLEKLLRNKEQSGLVQEITDKSLKMPLPQIEEDNINELDENVQYQPIETNEVSLTETVVDLPIVPSVIQPDIVSSNIPKPMIPKPMIKKPKKKIVIIDKQPEQFIPINEENGEKVNLPQEEPKQLPKKKKILIINKTQRPIINLQKDLVNRLPHPKQSKSVILKTSRFYLNNRKMFLKNFEEIFKKYKKEIENAETENITCDSKTETRNLFIHQRIVKDYLNLHTPYRGLLLYHGLGSGKTCTSIAIAEGMKIPDKRIYILTPASLKMNYFSELKKCGDELYKKKQYWEFVSIEGYPEYLPILVNALSLPEDYILKNKGAWLVNVKKNPNFETLTGEQQKEIDDQLNKMIRTKYTDINYNGMNYNKMKRLTNDYSHNPFDNSVVIIDEAHNFVSRIVNSLKKKGKKEYDNSSNQPPKSINIALYQYLMDAKNVRIVLLSGTPIINYPHEISVLYNILRGYIKTWTFQIMVGEGIKERINKETILEYFDKSHFKTFDYIEYSGNKLIVTRNPFGFINSKKASEGIKTKKMIQQPPTNIRKTITNKKINSPTESALNKADEQPNADFLIKGGMVDQYNGVYLDDDESFDGQGNMSDEMFERTIVNILNKHGLYVSSNNITITKNKCLPDNEDDFFTTFVNMEETKLKNEDVFKRRILGLTSYFRSSQEKLLPRFIPSTQITENNGKQSMVSSVFHMIYCPMSNFQFKKYIIVRDKEIIQEKNKIKQKTINEKKGVFNENSTYRIYSREVCNFAFPDPPGRPVPISKLEAELNETFNDETDNNGEDGNENDIIEEGEEEEMEGMDIRIKRDYLNRIQQSMKLIDSPEYLSEETIEQYSPKFSEFLRIFRIGLSGSDDNDTVEHEINNKGCHLLYSNFRTIEGIGILRLALLNNGYEEFKIRKTTVSGNWEIVTTEGSEFSNLSTYKRFVLYTGTETAEEKEIIRNIYNGDWDLVPSSISTVLREKAGYTDNMFGEVIRLFMITASGSEGINLRNTRFVHIIEPYWNLTRVEQIIGRASRICSHASLPEEFRTVKVYMYVSIFNDEKNIDEDIDYGNKPNATFEKISQIDVIKMDSNIGPKEGSRLDGNIKLTTDEALLEISTIKNRINSLILKAVKETAIDCKMYEKSHEGEGLKCYNGFGIVKSNSFGSFPSIQQDIGERMEQNVENVETKLVKITIKGKPYKMNIKTNEVFEEIGQGDNKEFIPVGVLVKEIGKGKKVDYRLVTNP